MNQAGASIDRATKQKELDSIIDNIGSRLRGIEEGVRRVQEFRHRLLSPRPAEVNGKNPSTPSSPSIEGRLRELVEFAQRIQGELNEVCGDLDSAA